MDQVKMEPLETDPGKMEPLEIDQVKMEPLEIDQVTSAPNESSNKKVAQVHSSKAHTTTGADLEGLKDKLQILKSVALYKKKWPQATLAQSIEDWKEVARKAFADLYSGLENGYPGVKRNELARSVAFDPDLAHIENVRSKVADILFDGDDEDI